MICIEQHLLMLSQIEGLHPANTRGCNCCCSGAVCAAALPTDSLRAHVHAFRLRCGPRRDHCHVNAIACAAACIVAALTVACAAASATAAAAFSLSPHTRQHRQLWKHELIVMPEALAALDATDWCLNGATASSTSTAVRCLWVGEVRVLAHI